MPIVRLKNTPILQYDFYFRGKRYRGSTAMLKKYVHASTSGVAEVMDKVNESRKGMVN